MKNPFHSLVWLVGWLTAVSAAQSPAAPPPKTSHWAFVRPQRPALPRVTNSAAVRNAVDRFIVARLEGEGIAPAPEADRYTLIRRLTLDLTGLPPTPAEVDAFVNDPRADAYEQLVERLLASPHFGERWGRWWLDVARYADSNGYSIDAPRQIWKYRDWVIDALNRDLPFDQFTIEQIAGDLLPKATVEQRVATGFHRNTQINQEGGIDKEQFRIESVFDRVATTGTAWLGLTIACAQCHDHKYDPLSQREYYQLFAFFNQQDEPTLELPTAAEKEQLAKHTQQVGELTARLKQIETDIRANAANPKASREFKDAEDKLAKFKKNRPSVTSTLVLAERKEPRETRLFIKGDFTRPSDVVSPGVPAVLPPLTTRTALNAGNTRQELVPVAATKQKATPEKALTASPDRLDLARWIVAPENPLTARVTVNRIWQQYFGRGIVETENDFGTQGLPPTHPELLDFLATELIAQKWSLKAIHRLIVSSATYRQSSHARPDLAEIDATNKLLARQNRLRLDAEIVRDAALGASGLLSPKLGGPPVFPPQPDGVMALGQVKREWKVDADEDRYRRGIYTFLFRATPHPALAVFDAPDGFSTCTRRMRSNTPLQALTLLNDQQFHEFARGLASRMLTEGPADPRERIAHGFRLCLARPPAAEELDRLEALLQQQLQHQGDDIDVPASWKLIEKPKGVTHQQYSAWVTVARVLLNLDETITRE